MAENCQQSSATSVGERLLLTDGTILTPGDHLLFSRKGFFNKAIEIKTWSKFSHVEIYVGHGKCIAARNGIGVDIFNIDTQGLGAVLRPVGFFDLAKALKWFETVRGQKYDWCGLFRFFTFGKQSVDKQFCSEVATRFDRNADFHPFSLKVDADLISPGMFYSSPEFDIVKEY